MDFFATGGFQQVFNDLEDADLHEHSAVFTTSLGSHANLESCNYYAPLSSDNKNTLIRLSGADDPFVLGDSTNEQTLLELHVDWCDTTADTAQYRTADGNSNSDGIHTYEYRIINDHELQLTFDQLLSTSPTNTSEFSNNNNALCDVDLTAVCGRRFSVEELQNLNSADSLESNSIHELKTNAFITREMAEWEEKFLDNYIEIPELIDFLPEKTPLCTETCEHFLHESSKNLKLHRKVRTTKRSKELATNAAEERTAAGYICNFGTCDKVYAKPAHLKAHMRRHMGEKPYICNWPECTWKFSRSDELARHRRSHSGVKPYKCNYCMKCFARSDHLTKHRKVHERRLLAASKAGKTIDGVLPQSVFTVRPGRKRKKQIC
ncbi:Kruppel-like factor 1 [Eurosta solidaginis]|uniref:Kruppel-like factor 1 n=1 Tax=Eurosta solidaginis TaxID=178769 RepID=UPI0035311B96